MIQIKPELFKAEEIEEYEYYNHKARYAIPYAGIAFLAVSYMKWRLYFKDRGMIMSTAMIIGAYFPSFIYYNYWRTKENKLFGRLSSEYEE